MPAQNIGSYVQLDSLGGGYREAGYQKCGRQNRGFHGSLDSPIRYVSTARAALRPSEIAQTTSDCPRRMSPAANTPGTEDIQSSPTATLPRGSSLTPSWS